MPLATAHAYPLNQSSVAMPVHPPGPTVKYYSRGGSFRENFRTSYLPVGLLSLLSSIKCQDRPNDSGRRRLPVRWRLDDSIDAASRTTQPDPRRWIKPTLRTSPPSVGLVCLVRRVSRSDQQFRLEASFRFVGASTTRLIRIATTQSGPRRWTSLLLPAGCRGRSGDSGRR